MWHLCFRTSHWRPYMMCSRPNQCWTRWVFRPCFYWSIKRVISQRTFLFFFPLTADHIHNTNASVRGKTGVIHPRLSKSLHALVETLLPTDPWPVHHAPLCGEAAMSFIDIFVGGGKNLQHSLCTSNRWALPKFVSTARPIWHLCFGSTNYFPCPRGSWWKGESHLFIFSNIYTVMMCYLTEISFSGAQHRLHDPWAE